MTLPTLDKTWIHTTGDLSPVSSVNQEILAQGTILATNTRILRLLIQSLIGLTTCGMTCMGSSDGSAADAVDGDPHTSKIVDDADLVWATEASPHSWIVLEAGDGAARGPQVLITLNANAPSNGAYGVHFYLSPGHTLTGGTATASPTGTDLVNLDPTPEWVQNADWTNLTVDANARLHVFGADDRSSYHAIVLSSGGIKSWIHFGLAKNAVTTDWAVPWYGLVHYNGMRTTNLVWRSWIDGGAAPYGYFTGEAWFPGTVNGANMATAVPDDQTGEYPLAPVGLYSATSLKRGRKGAIFDLFWGLSVNANGDTYPNDGTKQLAQFGDLVVPWDGSSVETV